MPIRKPSVHHRPKQLRVFEPQPWRAELPAFVPPGWTPRLDVPRTRAECPSEHATCPHVRCRHHLWLIDTRDRPGRRVSPREGNGKFMGRERIATASVDVKATPPASILRPATPTVCALAVVEHNRTGMRYEDIGRLLGITGERVRQIAIAAARKLKAAAIRLGAGS